MRKFRSALALCLVLALVATFAPAMSLSATSSEPEIWEGDVATEYDGGTGAKADPYQIATAEQLAFFAANVNGGEAYIGKNFVLTNDILLNDTTNWKLWNETTGLSQTWTPIGTEANPFKGNFDGAGFSVSGIYISDTALQNQGLFGYVNGSTIQNLTVKESFIYAGTNVAAVVGYSENGATIQNCKNEAKVTATVIRAGGVVGVASSIDTIKDCENSGLISGKDRIGGVAGVSNGTIKECKNFGKITGTGTVAGGVAGWITGKADRCENNGEVVGGTEVGGIGGRCVLSLVTSCYNKGSVSGTETVGGIAGYFTANNKTNGVAAIRFCKNDGDVVATSTTAYAGGIAGLANARGINVDEKVEHCMNKGTINGACAAGIVGGLDRFEEINNSPLYISACYNEGQVVGTSCICGILSTSKTKNASYRNTVKISDCYNAGDIGKTGSKADAYGIMIFPSAYFYSGIVDYTQGTDNVERCYNVGIVNGTKSEALVSGYYTGKSVYSDIYYLNVSMSSPSEGGTSLTYDEMIEQDSFENWDFDTVWQMGGPDGYEYPTLMKGVVDAPETAPVVESVSADSVTLQAKEGYEYRVKGGEWQQSNVITGLEPETEYTFYQRWAEDLLTYASAASTGTKATTDAAPTTTATETATETATSATEPSETEPSETEPSETEPSETEPSATEPSATEPSATEPSTPAASLLGDANNDDAVNMKDVLIVRKFLAGLDVTVDMANSDVNEDTFVNMKDVLMLRKFLANIIDKLGA